MLSGNAFHCEPVAAADCLHRLVDLGPLREHDLSVERADVVEVDVHREARHVEHEEVERRAAFQSDASAQERVAPQSVEQAEQAKGFLQRLGRKPGRSGLPLEVLEQELHDTSAQARDRTWSGTTRFQRETSFPGSRRWSR